MKRKRFVQLVKPDNLMISNALIVIKSLTLGRESDANEIQLLAN